MAINAAFVVLSALLLQAGPWVEITIADAPAETVAKVQQWANVSVWVTLLAIGIGTLMTTVQQARRMAGTKPLRRSATTLPA